MIFSEIVVPSTERYATPDRTRADRDVGLTLYAFLPGPEQHVLQTKIVVCTVCSRYRYSVRVGYEFVPVLVISTWYVLL